MEIKATGLEMTLSPLGRADAEDWAKVALRIRCNGFGGDFAVRIQTEDIRRFHDELHAMYEDRGHPSSARLCSAKRDIDVEFRIDAHCRVTGGYRFESEPNNGTPTVLWGEFETDLDVIPDLIKQIDELASSLKHLAAYRASG
jgi:hypothetical protein